jgi:predicted TIM-barrel fold metal-dependent hydrolase
VELLTRHPQVPWKVSGLVTEADHERLMFGSGWPARALAGGWNRWAATAEELLGECSARETEAALAGTATAFYRPAPTPPPVPTPTSTTGVHPEGTPTSR